MSLSKFRAVAALVATLLLIIPNLAFANVVKSFRVWPSPDETRVVIDLSAEADYSYFSLSGPDRLVVDLKNTSMQAKLPVSVTDSPVLKRVRKSSPPNKNTYRLVFELKKGVKAELFTLSRHRVVNMVIVSSLTCHMAKRQRHQRLSQISQQRPTKT